VPCTFSQPWCGVIDFVRGQATTPAAKRDAEIGFKVFGTMGIRGYDGPHASRSSTAGPPRARCRSLP